MDPAEPGASFSKKRLRAYFVFAYLGAAAIIIGAIVLINNDVVGQKPSESVRSYSGGPAGGVVEPGHALIQPAPFKTETLTIEIEDLGELEYKLIMPEDATLVFSWKVLGETPSMGVYFDFHGHPPTENGGAFPEGFFKSYATGEQSQQSGGFVAPFAGYHGWYFLNLEARAITLEIEIAGYYERHLELYRSVNGEVITRVPF